MNRKPSFWMAAGAILCVAVFLAGYSGLLGRLREMAHKPVARAPATEASIAILPFKVGGANDDSRYLSEGVPQELIVSLSRLEKLKVIGRTSSFQFEDQTIDARAAGAKLGVSWLLEGSAHLSGNQLQVSVELVNAADGLQVWSQSFDHSLQGLITTESDIANAVARQLGVDSIGSNARILQTPTRSLPSNEEVGAYLALLQGDFHSARGSESELRQAITAYDDAIRLDPDYAMAYARLSLALSTLSADWLTGAAVATANARATGAAQTALRLAPDLSEGHEALANVEFVTAFDRSEAGGELRRAVELAPSDSEPKVRLGEWLAARGQIEEGLALLKSALVVDPLYMEAYLRTAMALSGLGRNDEAEAVTRKALALQPTAERMHLLLAELALMRGKPDGAQDEARQEPDPFWREYALALVAQQQGGAAADTALAQFISHHSLDDASQIAVLYAVRKEPDRMFEWLNRAITERDSGVFWWLLGDPFLMAYKDDPRFGPLCVRLGIDLSAVHA